jgi:hypothetical protein
MNPITYILKFKALGIKTCYDLIKPELWRLISFNLFKDSDNHVRS